MSYVVFMKELAFTKVDDQGIPVGEEEIVQRGGKVPSYVPPFIVNALANSGMIVDAGPDALVALEAAPVFPMGPDNPPGPEGQVPLLDLGAGAGDTSSPAVRPADKDSKAKWEAYAEGIGIERATAESMTKAELIAAVEAREAETA